MKKLLLFSLAILFAFQGWTKVIPNYYAKPNNKALSYQLEFGDPSNCLATGTLTIRNITAHSVDVTWSKKGTALQWDVEYKPVSELNWINAFPISVADTIVSLAFLDDNSVYNIRVRSNCGSGSVSTWEESSFRTACEAISIIPWNDNFDTYGTIGNDIFPDCWTRNSTQSSSPRVYTTFFSPPNALYFYAANGAYAIAALPKIEQFIDINTLRLNFKYRSVRDTDTLKVGVMTDPNILSTWTQVGYFVAPTTGTWYDAEVSLAKYQANGKYISLRVDYTSTYGYGYVDDLVVSYIPACAKPTNIIVSNITPNSANLTWTAGHSTDSTWWIYYKQSGSSNWDSVYSVTNSYLLNNLTASSSYDIEIKTKCGIELSEPSYPVSLRTTCGKITNFPWTENFDNLGGIGVAYYPACWGKKTTNNAYPYSSTVNNSPPASLYFYALRDKYNIAILPAFESSIPINSLSLNFKLFKQNAAYNMTIGIMSDTANVSTFDSIINITPSSNNTWEKFDIKLSSYTGVGKYVAFKVEGFTGTNSMYLDDLYVYITPSCPIPSGLTDINSLATPNSITLDWDGSNDMNVRNWIIDYKQVNNNTWESVNVQTRPYTLTGLQSSVEYQIRISAVCSNGDITLVSNPIIVGMQCSPITSFPWIEGFDGEWHTSIVSSEKHPWCWTNIDGGNNATNWIKTIVSSYVRSGTGALQMNAAGTTSALSDWFVTPPLSLNGSQKLEFWAKGYSSSYTDDLNIQILDVTRNGILTNKSDTSLFTVIMPNTVIPSDDWNHYEISLNQFIGDYQIAFVRNTTGGFRLNIDDVSVSMMPQCARPTFIKFNNISFNSVDVSWIPGYSTDFAWWIYFRKSGTYAWDSVYTSTNPIALTSLSSNTEYEIYMRTHCGSGLSNKTNVVSFKTTCTPISAMPWSDNFDSYGVGTNVFPMCWTKNSTEINVPNINGNYSSPPASLYLYAGSPGKYCIAILPQIDQSIYVHALRLNFKYRITYTTDTLKIGVMTDPNDESTWTQVDYVTAANTGIWYDTEVSLVNSQGNGNFIAFRVDYPTTAKTANYAYIDDLIVSYIPPCSKPNNVIASNITTNSAIISWTRANSTDIAWMLYYKQTGSTNWDSIFTSNPYLFNNLSPNTSYDIKIKTACGGEFSESSYPISFRTACSEIFSFPWKENFDTYGGTGLTYYPICWGKKTTYQSYPYLHATNNSDPASLYFYATKGNYNLAILPKIHSSVLVNSLSLNFKLQKASASYNITIGVMSDTSSFSTFDTITNISPFSINTWEAFNIELSNYSGSGQYIVFMLDGNNATNGMYLDDLLVYSTPTCSTPSDFTGIDSLSTPNSITLNWDGSEDMNVNSWIIDYKLADEDENAWQSLAVLTRPFILSGLQQNAVYQFKISAICLIGDTTLSSSPINVGTLCSAITSFPWTEGFEGNWYPASGVSSAEHPWCWNNIDGGDGTTYNTYNWKKTTSNSYVRTGSGALQMFTDNNNSVALSDWFITPILRLTGNEKIQFWAKGYSTSSTDFIVDLNIQILDVSTNGSINNESDTNLFTVIMPNTIIPSSDWTEYEISLSRFAGDYQIAFVRNTTGGYYLNIDDISVSTMPQCARPTLITINNISHNSVDISWTPGRTNDFSWWVYYRQTGTSAWDSVNSTTSLFTITNLIPNSDYEVEVRTICGSQLSHPSIINNFTTPCSPIANIPYNESFDTYGGVGASYFPDCWNKITTYQSFPYLYTINNSPPAALYFYAQTGGKYNLAILHKIDTSISIETLMVSFWMRSGVANSNCVVGIMDSPDDPTTFTPIETVIPSATNTWENFEVYLHTYTGTGRYIAFKSEGITTNNVFYLDDVAINYMPSCPKPVQLNASNITPSSADISWTAGNQAYSSWWLYYKVSSANNFDSVYVSNTLTYNFNNLNANTEYTYYLKTVCDTKYSKPSIVNTFRTPCYPIVSLPYTENFDTYGGTGTAYFPNCWTKITTYSSYPYIYGTNHSAPASLYFYATSGNYNLAILHKIDPSISIDTLIVSFWIRTTNETSNCIVGIMDSFDDPATFIPIDTVTPLTKNTWEDFEVYLHTYTGSGRYIAFKSEYNTTNNIFYLDDVVVDYIPICPKPIQLNLSNITSSSIDISWATINQVSNSWWIYWKESSATSYDSVLVNNTTTYTLRNLNHSSEFDIYMRTDCIAGTSEQTKIQTFFTKCMPIASFPWTEGFENVWIPGIGISNDQVPDICWVNINGGGTSYKWRKSSNSTIPSYVKTGSGAAQLYGANRDVNAYLMTPVITFTGNQQVIFWGKGYSSTQRYPENLWIKAYNVSRNGDIASYSDTTLFTNLAFISDTNNYTWNEYEIPLRNLIGDYRLVFARDNNVGYYYQLDDLEVDIIPACPRPISASADSITQNSAIITWKPGTPNDAIWKIYFKPSISQTWDSIITTNNPHTLTGLSASTTYDVGIATDCRTGKFSNMRITSLKTDCGTITFLPWKDDFDSYGTGSSIFPDCWTRNTTQASRPYVNTAGYSSPGCLYFQASNANAYNIAAIPPIDQTINISSLIATFKYKNRYATDKLLVGVMTDPSQESTFVAIDTISAPTTDSWYDYTINLASYTGIGQYLAFKINYSGTATEARIDDLKVSYYYDCAAPINIAANYITNTSANITWVAGGTETSWQIKEGSSGSPIDLTNNTYQATGLVVNTSYTFYVRSNCGASVYSNWVPINFTTTNIPIINTSNITIFTHNTATFIGSYIKGGDTITGIGFEYKALNSTTWNNAQITPITSPFSFNATGLIPNTAYEVVAYTKTKVRTFYGDTVVFTTNQLIPPSVTTDTIIVNFTNKSAIFKGTISQGTHAIIARGFEYKSISDNWSNAIDLSATGSGNITATTTSLQVGIYNVRAYAETQLGKTYGDILVFATAQSLPQNITTSNVTMFTHNTATFAGMYTAGTDAITGIGFKYKSQSSSNWTNKSITPIASPFTYNATGLIPNTSYQIIAYVSTQTGTYYGDTVVFTTKPLLPPTITTSSITVFTHNTATFAGTYTTGIDAITGIGFKYKSQSSSTWINESIVPISSPFTYNAIGLIPNTKYEVIAYTTTQAGTFYGDTIVFTTKPILPPTITTSSITIFTHNTATFAGAYTIGTYAITGIGFKYKSQTSSTWINESIVPISSPFTYNATGLIPNTKYEVIAYATTQAGTFYGDTLVFTTNPLPPTVTTDTIIVNYTNKSAIFKGTISQGTYAIIARGFEYKNISDSWSNAIDLSATGSVNITATATSLQVGIYNVRAYAITQEGKTYGDILVFATSQSLPQNITTSNVTMFTHNTATFRGIYAAGSDPITGIGFKYKSQTSSTWNNIPITPIASPFTYNASGLIPNTSYKVIAYVSTQTGTYYGDTVVFTTNPILPPVVTTSSIPMFTHNTATFVGAYTPGTDAVTGIGFKYKSQTSSTWINEPIAPIASPFTFNAIGLSSYTSYQVIAYATTQAGTFYGDSIVFTTRPLSPPIITTSSISVTHNTATFMGTYAVGIDPITGIGFKYKAESSSTWNNIPITPIASPFAYNATGLIPNTKYEVIAYATTQAGNFNGNTVVFTSNPILPPNVTTDTVIVNNDKSATFKGSVSKGSDVITARGFEYKNATANWSNAIDIVANGSANITATTISLLVDKYNVRAYAETLEGKTYGGILNFEIVSSLNSIEGNSLEVNLYPNPANNEATLSIKGVNGKTKISINDVHGRIIYTIDKNTENGKIIHSLDLNNCAKGVYYIRIQNSNSIKTQKLIVQ